jgi:FkbM family methyltransferase
MNKLKIIWDIISLVKNWPKVFWVKFGFLNQAEVYFRNGYNFNLNPKNWGQFLGYVKFFGKASNKRKVENGLVYFDYNGKNVVFDCGNREPYIAAEVFESAYEDFFNEEVIKDKIVIDLGCSIGDTPVYFALKGAKRVIGIEMLPYRANLAVKNISLNSLKNVCQIVNAAVGGKKDKILVSVNQENSEHYTNLRDFAKKEDQKSLIEIPVITLEDIVKNYHIEEGSVIKSDLQGGEREFFINASDDDLKKFSFILIKFYYLRDEVIKILKDRLELCGFRCKYYKPPKWGAGYLIVRNLFASFPIWRINN